MSVTVNIDLRNFKPSVKTWDDQKNNTVLINFDDGMILLNPSTIAQAFKIVIENEMQESVMDADFLLLLKQYADRALIA